MITALILSLMTSQGAKDFCRKHLIDDMPPELQEFERELDEREARERDERIAEELRGRFIDHGPKERDE